MNESENKSGQRHWNTANPYTYHNINELRADLLKNMTVAECVLWERIKSNQLGVRFRRQHIIGNYIPDFVCLLYKLIVEVDGEIHNFQKDKDTQRTFDLSESGYKVLRFTNEEVLNDTERVISKIKEILKDRI